MRKPRTVRVYSDKVCLKGGPYSGMTAALSGYAKECTLQFTARGMRGHYAREHAGVNMLWVPA